MSRTIMFAKAGGPEVLEFVNKEVAASGPAEVRIKVKAIGLNRAESMWRPNRTAAAAATARGAERHVEVQVGAGAEGLRIAAAVSRVTAAAADRRWLGGTAWRGLGQDHRHGCQLHAAPVGRQRARLQQPQQLQKMIA
jgi:NADPH:quinone reductase-like Zn-dependent oxidoreductase